MNETNSSNKEEAKCIFTEKNGAIGFHNHYGTGFFFLSLFLYFEAFAYLFIISVGEFVNQVQNEYHPIIANILLIMCLDVALGTIFFFSNSNKGKNWYTYFLFILNICARLWGLVTASYFINAIKNNSTYWLTEGDNIYLQNILFETTIVLCICLMTLLIFAIIYLYRRFKNTKGDEENV